MVKARLHCNIVSKAKRMEDLAISLPMTSAEMGESVRCFSGALTIYFDR